MTGRFFLILLLVLSLPVPGRAQVDPYRFQHLDIRDGLSHNQVNCFLRDKKGFLWIGTMSGLNRYDGYTFRIFRNSVKDSTTLVDNYILKLFEDPRHRIWVVTTFGLSVYDPQTEKFIRDVYPLMQEFSIPGGVVKDIIEDSKGNYWFIHQQEGLFRYDPVQKATTHIRKPAVAEVSSMTEDSDGNFWVIYHNGLLEKLDGGQFNLLYTSDELARKNRHERLIYNVKASAAGDLWIYITNSNRGIYYLDAHDSTLHAVSKRSDRLTLNSDIVRDLEIGADGLVWVATDHGGINLIDRKNNTVRYLVNNPEDNNSLRHNAINTLYRDHEGMMWIGSNKEGVHYYHADINKFPLYRHRRSDAGSLPFDDINAFVEDDRGNLWIGTNGGGLICFDRNANTFTQYVNDPADPNSLHNNVIVSLCMDHEQKLWIGTYYGGLDCFDGRKFTHYRHNPHDSLSLSDDNIWEIMEDSQHNLWIGTLAGGLNVLDPERKSFKTLGIDRGIFTKYVPSLLEDSQGNIWVGSGYGLTMLNVRTGEYTHMLGSEEPGSLSNNSIMSLLEDSRGYIWVGTQDGLNVYNRRTGSFRSFRQEDGLPANTILCMLEDDAGHLWVSTPTAISNVIIHGDPAGDTFRPEFKNYGEQDGLQGKQFNENAAFKTGRGELIFGGVSGFNLFRPGAIRVNDARPVVVLTGLQIHNRSVSAGERINGKVILEKPITETRHITLRHVDNVFSIEFAALSYFHPEKNSYRYRLEGFDREWIETDGAARKVAYTNLDPGEYVFTVKAANSDGFWNEQGVSLHIEVLPPFWKSKAALAVYLAVTLGALLLTRQVVLARERMKYKIARERMEASRVHELDLLKIKFFTNVSHEFRTPLSLILAPVERLLKQVKDQAHQDQLLMMRRNARRLLNLVNQLLDFRRMEVQEVKLNPSEGDIVKFVREVTLSFSDLSEKNNIAFSFYAGVDSLETLFDQNKLERILFNLISNAFKFTPEGGQVSVTLEQVEKDDTEWIEIKVKDTGIGIPREKQARIFERFFQNELPASLVNQGSGIGLSITREFVKIHGGSIHVESEPDQGSCFTVRIPVRAIRHTAAVSAAEDPEEAGDNSPAPHAERKKPVVLLVEDNEDFRFYLEDNLKQRYQIETAQDGKEGWQQALHIMPDLIVSDIMMPEMDGIALCRKAKNDPRTSHIPVILLTARSAEEQKMEGFESGADDYVTKPFNFEILQARIKNLIALRAAFRKTFQKTIQVRASDIKVSSLDEQLIEKAIKMVEDHIADPDFSVENLSRELGMSRVHLYKKLLSLTGKSPIEFIRTLRLQRAALLLEKSQLTVAEVAYKVGFNNPKYFARYFKEQFKVLPSVYAATNKK